ncbi:MAG TPA: serine hydrolase [Myxococcaceae bacterium]|jgi:CubicO group peptidase (beta-lactamase class C family)
MSLPRAAAAALLCAAAAAPTSVRAACPNRGSWPTDGWPSIAGQVATQRQAEIAALESYAFTLSGKDEERLGLRTDGLVIIKNGQIVYERYARGWDAAKPHIAWSVTKSVTNALVGVAKVRGALSEDDKISKYVTITNPDSRAADITIRNLMEFSSGFDWREAYEHESYQVSSVLAMLYGVGHKDAVKFVTSHPLRDAPGTSWDYSTGDSTLLSSVVTAAMVPSFGEDFAFDLLFSPIGMKTAVLERDPRGGSFGGSYLYATPQDLARFGYLYLSDGCWAGARVLPDGWVAASTATVAPPFRLKVIHPDNEPTGWQWWLNQAVPEQSIATRPWPDVPGDAYAAEGHWGQRIIVVPSQDVVIVRTGDDRNATMSVNDLASKALAVAR